MKYISFANLNVNLNNEEHALIAWLTAISIIFGVICIFAIIGAFIFWIPMSPIILRLCMIPVILILFVGFLNANLEHKKNNITTEEYSLNNKITRVSIVSKDGRDYDNKATINSYYQLSFQDDGRTLKLFETFKG